MFGILDEGVNALEESTKVLIESMGSQYIRTISYRESWVMIGVKG